MADEVLGLKEPESDDDHDPSPPGIGVPVETTPDAPASLTPGTSPASA